MAQQAEQEFKSEMDAAGQEFAIEMKALGQQYLTDEQYNNKAAILHGKHSVKALKMNRGWNQRMTMIQQYEKLGAAGTVTPEQSSQEQFALSGYDVPKREQPNYWAEHRNLVQQRERIQAEMLDPWDWHKGKWKLVDTVYPSSSKKSGQVHTRGREATPQERIQIKKAQDIIGQLDQYEFALLTQMNPQQRRVNQLSRAMAMGPRVSATPGVGGRRTRIPLGTGTPEDPFRGYAPDGSKRKQERFETLGYKMTHDKAIEQAEQQLGEQASEERVIALARQIYGASK
jgi:hypothetical protein